MNEVSIHHKHVTKHGKRIAKLIPINNDTPTDFFGGMKGKTKIIGDLISPINTKWCAKTRII
jgi:hypothetical protein